MDRDRRLCELMGMCWHRVLHALGWNTGIIETWWEGKHLMVGFRCECGEMQGIAETTIKREQEP